MFCCNKTYDVYEIDFETPFVWVLAWEEVIPLEGNDLALIKIGFYFLLNYSLSPLKSNSIFSLFPREVLGISHALQQEVYPPFRSASGLAQAYLKE